VNGQPALKTSQKGKRAMAAVVKSTVATGGVCWPTPRLIVTMIPKWIGSTPIWRMRGMTIGTIRIIAAAEWRNIPATKKKMFKKKRIAYLFEVVSRIVRANFWGICSLVRNQPRTAEEATISMTTAVCPVVAVHGRSRHR
jgi:hypothetical protein